MFTGIIEAAAQVVEISQEGSNYHFTLESSLAPDLKIDQSMAHDGVCLTVVKIFPQQNRYVVTAMDETIQRSSLKAWKVGTEVNLERSMRMDGRFDGHIVQGHVDQTALCKRIENLDGSWKFFFEYKENQHFTVEKGSICVNGVSLTVVDSEPELLSVAIIPYTYQVTNFHQIQVGSLVNLEFDVLGKYMSRLFAEYIKQTQK